MNAFLLKYSAFISLALCTVTISAGGGYLYWQLYQDSIVLQNDVLSLSEELRQKEGALASTTEALALQKNINESFEEQISGIAETVGTLDKLSKTDRELLQKYSKIYFLNENYVPENLTTIDPEFVFDKDKKYEVHTKAYSHLKKMLLRAKEDGINLRVISSYRSFGTQGSLKSNYTVIYGTGANKFSADQGYSEHQLGTTIDFTTLDLGSNFTLFEKSEGYSWLIKNAHSFGFIISYPKGNSYYQFEPWHWRFVGEDLAGDLFDNNKYFYDVGQREIDKYLVSIFD